MIKLDKSKKIYAIVSIMLAISSSTYAMASTPTIEFYISNNTHEITVEEAYKRLIGKAQHELKASTIDILQKNHIEQGKLENILGTYEMASDKNITGDNTEIFHASPLQNFSQNQIFSVATELANTLQQESIAVFIPTKQYTIANIAVNFRSHQPNITETIALVREKLPAYSTAFSLHLSNKHSGFNNARVTEIEWLGNININEIQKAFPQEKISYHYGQAYLVYKNGHIELL